MATRRAMTTFLLGAAAGAALAYLLDPDRGRARRARTRDQVAALFRRTGRRTERLARRAGSESYGALQRATHRTSEDTMPDDATLAHKVESEVLGDPSIPKGRILVNVETGVVVLRGEVDREEQIRHLEERILKLPGVAGIENLLHLPGEPAPNKEAALEASRNAETR